jgi:hypothetical protein
VAAESARLAEAHRVAQARLGAQTIRMQRVSWPLLNLTNLSGSEATWLRTTVPIVSAQAVRSARLAGDYMVAARALDLGWDDDYRPLLARPNPEQIATSLRVTGPVEIRRLIGLGVPLQTVGRRAFVSSARAGSRLSLLGGRDTIMDSIRADRSALGWTRIGSGSPCGFCAMLISRGPVYRTAATGDFQAHDNCSCGAQPVYRREDGWTDQARLMRDTWREATAGKSGRDAVNAFRRAVEAA